MCCLYLSGNQVREQPNVLTSYIDGSAVYGSTDDEAKELRAFRNGQLKVSSGKLLPIDTSDKRTCLIPEENPDKQCFLAGN